MIGRLKKLDPAARLQYSLMIVLGSVCLLAALAPIDSEVKIAAVSVTFGITVGLWISHLITVIFLRNASVAVDE